MKTRTSIAVGFFTATGLGTTALAAVDGRSDHSSFVVWAFLGFCALIVIAQLLPALRNTRLAAREVKEGGAEESQARAAVEE